MKNLHIKIIFAALLMAVVTVSAQNKHPQYLTNRFFDNWYISVGAGEQIYWGNPWRSEKGTNNFYDRASVTYNLSLGKWMTPNTGLRLQGNFTPEAKMFGKGVIMKNMFNIHADVLFNMTNVFGGYREQRVYQPILFVGGGYGQGNLTNEACRAQTFTLNAGLINKFRVSKHVDLNLELAAMMAPRSFDGFRSAPGSNEIKIDAAIQASVGVTYRFGAKGFERYVKVPEVDLTPYYNKIEELDGALSAAISKASELRKKVAELESRKPEVITGAVTESVVMPAISVYYNLGSSVLGPKELVILEDVSKIISQTPGVKYSLAGLIDYSVGSVQVNEKLCQERIDATYRALISFGIKPEQLVKMSGTPASPSKNPILNRGVVIAPIKNAK